MSDTPPAPDSPQDTPPGLRRRLYIGLNPAAWPHSGLSPLNLAVCGLIIVSATLAVLETEPVISSRWGGLLLRLEWLFSLAFLVEYLARVWTSVENPRYGTGWRGRLRYMVSPGAVLDLLALAPVLLTLLASEAFLLRLFRLLRILRLARLGRFSGAMACLGEAVSERRHELVLSLLGAIVLLMISSTLLYLVEGGAQPEAFGSIPRAMWWSVATLTTVGYGDVYPVTALGRVLAAVTALTGIGLIAMPTGILAAAFSDAMQRQRDRR